MAFEGRKTIIRKMVTRLPQIIIVDTERRPSTAFLSAFYAYTRAFSRSIKRSCFERDVRILRIDT